MTEPPLQQLHREADQVTEPFRIAVVSPVFDDWPSCARLVRELDAVAANLDGVLLDLVVVDDGSTAPGGAELVGGAQFSHINRALLVQLACNLGHQRAIAAGLYAAGQQGEYDAFIVMDSDGEDRPGDIPSLVEELRRSGSHAVFARRSKRSEGMLFKGFYRLYKGLYRLLTGSEISFGNFSIITREAANRLLHMPELWNNFSSAVLRSRLAYRQVETERGERYAGDSKMNFPGLVIHGLSAISVSSEIIFVRVMVLCALLGLGTLAGGVAVLGIRLFTGLAIPGWASDVMGTLVIIFTQTVFFFLVSMFLLLRSRSTPAPSPVTVIPGYISCIRVLSGDDRSGV